MSASIVLCGIVLNEIEWISYQYEQHKNWPGMVKWIFVESADINYARTNPTMVTSEGLSVDGTTSFLRNLAQNDPRIIHIEYGFCGKDLPKDQAKCESRSVYLREADKYKPDLLVCTDQDEFYKYKDQQTISDILQHTTNTKFSRVPYRGSAFCFNQRHIWYPPYIQADPLKESNREYKLFSHEVIGGYWEVIHCRVWRWEPGLRYHQNHNWPEDRKGSLLVHKNETMLRNDRRIHYSLRGMANSGILLPQCIHMGYAANAGNRRAKHQYYIDRGEGSEPDIGLRHRRIKYVNCRHAWNTWEPGDKLPYDAHVIPYKGPVPECFMDEVKRYEKR